MKGTTVILQLLLTAFFFFPLTVVRSSNLNTAYRRRIHDGGYDDGTSLKIVELCSKRCTELDEEIDMIFRQNHDDNFDNDNTQEGSPPPSPPTGGYNPDDDDDEENGNNEEEEEEEEEEEAHDDLLSDEPVHHHNNNNNNNPPYPYDNGLLPPFRRRRRRNLKEKQKKQNQGKRRRDLGIVGGNDDRVVFRDTSYPYRTVGKIQYYDKIDHTIISSCTGTMVGPNLMLTAQHCIDYDGWFLENSKTLMFTPSYSSSSDSGSPSAPYGTAFATRIFYWESSSSSSSSNELCYHPYDDDNRSTRKETSCDYALVVLDRRIGDRVGWMGIVENFDTNWINNLHVNHIGYPGDFGGRSILFENGYILEIESFGNNNGTALLLESDVDAYPGQSGGPLYSYFGDDDTDEGGGGGGYNIIGVMSTGDGDDDIDDYNNWGGGILLQELRSHVWSQNIRSRAMPIILNEGKLLHVQSSNNNNNNNNNGCLGVTTYGDQRFGIHEVGIYDCDYHNAVPIVQYYADYTIRVAHHNGLPYDGYCLDYIDDDVTFSPCNGSDGQKWNREKNSDNDDDDDVYMFQNLYQEGWLFDDDYDYDYDIELSTSDNNNSHSRPNCVPCQQWQFLEEESESGGDD